jgi:glycosyltransferase involved in cell wall biosynthesis
LNERSFDVVQLEGIEMAWTIPVIKRINQQQRIVYDAHNAEALLQYRALKADMRNVRRWPAAAYSWIQQRRLKKFEQWIGKEVDWITTVSEEDKRTVAEQVGMNKITVIPNCIDVAAYENQAQSTQVDTISHNFDLVFIGKMDYRPNVDAVLWFADEVWPLIRARRAETSLAIVGQKPHARLDRLKQVNGITVTGWVESVQPYLAGSKVFVMPFRVGSGTRLKLIEALAARKAVVSTTVGVEGYPVRNGKELLLADSAMEMADKILVLLENVKQRQRLGESGVRFARGYDWRQVMPMYDDVYRALE